MSYSVSEGSLCHVVRRLVERGACGERRLPGDVQTIRNLSTWCHACESDVSVGVVHGSGWCDVVCGECRGILRFVPLRNYQRSV